MQKIYELSEFLNQMGLNSQVKETSKLKSGELSAGSRHDLPATRRRATTTETDPITNLAKD